MATNTLTGLNVTFEIKNADGTSFHDLVMHKSTVESIVMSLGDNSVIFGADSAGQGGEGGTGRTIEVRVSDRSLYVRHSELDEDEQVVLLYKIRRDIKIKGEEGEEPVKFKRKKWFWFKHLILSKGQANVWYIPAATSIYDQKNNAIVSIGESTSWDDDRRMYDEDITGEQMIAPGLITLPENPESGEEVVDNSGLQKIIRYRLVAVVESNESEGEEEQKVNYSFRFHGSGKGVHLFAIGIIKAGGIGSNDRNRLIAKAPFTISLTNDDGRYFANVCAK